MTRSFVLALALASLVGSTAGAQLREVRSYSVGGGGILIAQPIGEFRQFVGTHGGFTLSGTWGGPIGLRVGGSLLIYGHESQPIPFPGTGGRVVVDLTTDNLIGTLGLGPQITLGDGPVRLYGFGTVGLGYFATTSSVGDDCGCDDFASTTNFDDFTLARELGGGLQIGLGGRRPVFLDLGARYLKNGRARYLREGDIVENPDGTITLWPVESEANLVVFQVGLSVGLR